MTVFTVPPEAMQERSCFSVLDRTKSEELMIVPDGAVCNEAFDGALWFMDTAAPQRLPVGTNTLVREALAAQFSENPVYVSSRITEGTLAQLLQDKRNLFGSRLWLLIEPYRHAMPLPCPGGTLTEKAVLKQAPSFFSEEFCCRYCVHAPQSELYLFDTAETVKQKEQLAERIGIAHVLVLP